MTDDELPEIDYGASELWDISERITREGLDPKTLDPAEIEEAACRIAAVIGEFPLRFRVLVEAVKQSASVVYDMARGIETPADLISATACPIRRRLPRPAASSMRYGERWRMTRCGRSLATTIKAGCVRYASPASPRPERSGSASYRYCCRTDVAGSASHSRAGAK